MKSDPILPLQVPKIYAYTTPEHEATPWKVGTGTGLLKIGMTTKQNVEDRIREQFPVAQPSEKPWTLHLAELAVGPSGAFSDKAVHAELRRMGRRQITHDGTRTEWFECTPQDALTAITNLRTGVHHAPGRTQRFGMRPEQATAVSLTAAYFSAYPKAKSGSAPRFLWNAKMRFGKTFTTYQLARQMGWTRILVLTYKPAVEGQWREDLESHVDFDGWQFIGGRARFSDFDETKPFVWFASFQDALGTTSEGAVKERLEELYLIDWDCVVLDEYHFGSWRDTAQEFYNASEERKDGADAETDDDGIEYDVRDLKLDVSHYLYLSGTPFRSLINGEFTEDQIFSWTYAEEQAAKAGWPKESDPNPYAELPSMTLLTYQLPPDVREGVAETEQDGFSLNEFFKAKRDVKTGRAEFTHRDSVQKWLNLLRGQHRPFDPTLADATATMPPVPYDDPRLRSSLRHTLWYLPSVAACEAMRDLLAEPQNHFYHQFKTLVAAGTAAGMGLKALEPVLDAVGRPGGHGNKDAGLHSQTITLTCGKLLTGVSVPEWGGILMLRNTTSPETYFQAAFRVQTPWSYKTVDPEGGEQAVIVKPTCYVFDFAPNRALKLVADYATTLSSDMSTPKEQQVAEFLNFLPVLCFDGFDMVPLDAGTLLDFVAAGTASTMLARQWRSAQLIDVSTSALTRLAQHPELLKRLENLESFRGLSKDVTAVISAERSLRDLKRKEASERSSEDKKAISDEERKFRTKRSEIQERLKKFMARIPVFMYLTDYREEVLAHVITGLEPDLFERATNLTVDDFKLLCEIGVFKRTAMDSAVFSFRRFEDASLHYLGDAGTQPKTYGGFMSGSTTREDLLAGTEHEPPASSV